MTVNHWVAGSSPAGGAVLLLGTLESTLFPQNSWFSLKISTLFSGLRFICPKICSVFLAISCIFTIFSPSSLLSEAKNPSIPDITKAEQILLLVGKPGESRGELYFYSVEEGEWKLILPVFPVWFGRSGLIPKEEKREGDGFTPYGSYPIQRVFGKPKQSIPNLEYTQIQKNDYWSDVTTSKHYNQFIRKKEKGATSLWNSPNYHLFVVIEHNTKPSIPGLGSMIFIHPWEEDKPTSGCVGLKLVDLQTIIQQLDGDKNPFILIVPAEGNNEH